MGATILILLAAAVLLIFLIILSVFLVSRIRVKRDRSKMSRTGEGAKRVSKTKTGTPIKEIGSVKKIRCLKHK
ncbi:Apextrin C-terminal domain-containing protein [Caenorhabditis elegans]|uniref:Apextrin C-terminal domain-containing protein n=1 Tax=Caenorhabditis elegans TaxID=6239 RepID=G4SN17_CAEEL|nr:Apextrin C-terminal domain-containing protein [Caenorhabditis elegans]CCD72769.1 Apextrin C-terminal domain-containing protein [Caenorhabditis elegans]|eukprot:NP_001254019.1 Uncharacterized protein CELE_Y39F10C.1 [Caenorhabditis elegans]